MAEHGDATGCRRDRPGDAAEDRRLPRAVRPAKRKSFALRERHVDIAHDVALAEPAAEPLDQKRRCVIGRRRLCGRHLSVDDREWAHTPAGRDQFPLQTGVNCRRAVDLPCERLSRAALRLPDLAWVGRTRRKFSSAALEQLVHIPQVRQTHRRPSLSFCRHAVPPLCCPLSQLSKANTSQTR